MSISKKWLSLLLLAAILNKRSYANRANGQPDRDDSVETNPSSPRELCLREVQDQAIQLEKALWQSRLQAQDAKDSIIPILLERRRTNENLCMMESACYQGENGFFLDDVFEDCLIKSERRQ